MAMDFALFYEIPVPRPWRADSEHKAYKAVLEQAVLADRLGFHSFWTVEHHFLEEFSHCSAPGVLYGAVAALTRNIRIGHGVRLLPAPYNHPVRVAEAGAVLDLVCDGRLEFGTGRSSTRAEIEGFGIDPHQTRPMWEEALEFVVGAWTNDLFEWEGRFFKLPPRRVLPKPLQKPHPPIWAASTSPESHRIIGRKGLGLLSFTVGVPPEELAGRIALYRQGLAEAEPVGKFVNPRAATFTMVHCAPTRAEAAEVAGDSCAWYAATGAKQIASLAPWMEGKDMGTYDYAREMASHDLDAISFDYLDSVGAVLVGDPDRCVEVGKRFEAAGCDLLLCLVQPHSIPHDKVMRSIELLGTHVLPEFRH
jgi:alkanesulfonate monooxygenase SsuD/methylene tetrahydromethanopterin reductase-like flavin-dependent oxidoreductase (luciferase family)